MVSYQNLKSITQGDEKNPLPSLHHLLLINYYQGP